MAEGVEKMSGVGLIVENAKSLDRTEVRITGMRGEAVSFDSLP